MTAPHSESLIESLEVDQFLENKSPLDFFSLWLEEAKRTSLRVPEAFVLSTVSPEGHPNSRVLLLKEVKPEGLVFYTSYESEKAQEIQSNPKVAINFFWDPLWRQVKWQGHVKKMTRSESEAYWATRARESQLSQWVSKQSQPVPNRSHMERLLQEAEKQFQGQKIPCPHNWGGYLMDPTYVEFWIGRDGRFHDRYTYQKVENEWRGQRLYP